MDCLNENVKADWNVAHPILSPWIEYLHCSDWSLMQRCSLCATADAKHVLQYVLCIGEAFSTGKYISIRVHLDWFRASLTVWPNCHKILLVLSNSQVRCFSTCVILDAVQMIIHANVCGSCPHLTPFSSHSPLLNPYGACHHHQHHHYRHHHHHHHLILSQLS